MFRSLNFWLAQAIRFHPRPLGVRQDEAFHPKRESHLRQNVNPESPQPLGEGAFRALCLVTPTGIFYPCMELADSHSSLLCNDIYEHVCHIGVIHWCRTMLPTSMLNHSEWTLSSMAQREVYDTRPFSA